MFPGLTKLAKQILCVPAAATLSENVFCRAGFLVNDRRNLLKPEKVNDILFLHSNLDEATWKAKCNRPRKLFVSWTVGKRINITGVAGGDHILAQPLKRCTASRVKPNETFELAKKRQNFLRFGVCVRKNFCTLWLSYAQSPKNREKSLCPTVLQLKWVISTWWDENMTLFVFSACHEIQWNWFCERIHFKCSESTLFTAGAPAPVFWVIFHQILHIALGDELCYSVSALSGGIGMLPWSNVPIKWAEGLGQVHCQYGILVKLCTSCPCEVEFEVVLFFFEGNWYVSKNSSLRMFWYRDLNSSHFFPHFGLLEHEANRTPDISATFIGSRRKFCKRNRMSVCPARKRKPSILSLFCRLNRFHRCSRWRTTLLQISCQNMVRTWYSAVLMSNYVREILPVMLYHKNFPVIAR